MNIGITTFGCDHGRSGIGRYLHHHLREFARLGINPQLYTCQADSELVPDQFTQQKRVSDDWNHPLANILLHQTWLPLKARNLDVLFLPAANRRLPLFSGCPTVGTVHDLAVARLKGKYDQGRSFYVSRVLPGLIRRLDQVITVSQSSKRDIVEITGVHPSKVSVIPLGVDHTRYYPRVVDLSLEKLGIRSPYLLYVSRVEHPGKNHQQLLRAFAELKKRYRIPHQLVLAGPDWKGAEEVHRLADSLGCRQDVHFTGFFPESLLPQLYSQAELLVFPSLYEGFGLPLLEAMACQTAVICSNRASLPEVVGNSGELFEPDQPETLLTALKSLLFDAARRQDLAEEGRQRSLSYRWSVTAEATLQVLKGVARKGGRRAAA